MFRDEHNSVWDEQRLYEHMMQLVDDIALHGPSGFDPEAWRQLAEFYERGVEDYFRTHQAAPQQGAR
ncbi:MAG: hypothetical protein ACE5LB_12655 [Acidiferrobacterales bacterium]